MLLVEQSGPPPVVDPLVSVVVDVSVLLVDPDELDEPDEPLDPEELLPELPKSPLPEVATEVSWKSTDEVRTEVPTFEPSCIVAAPMPSPTMQMISEYSAAEAALSSRRKPCSIVRNPLAASSAGTCRTDSGKLAFRTDSPSRQNTR